MDNLKKALQSFMGAAEITVSDLAPVLTMFSRNSRVDYEAIAACVAGNLDDLLLILWEWKLIIPLRSAQCSEWDRRVLLTEPGELYEMPNISKVLVEKGLATGRWESPAAIRELFNDMGEPEWEKMPELVLRIKQDTRHNTINGAEIGAACRRCGLGAKTGAMIAILKGAGIISPKLAALNAFTTSRSPLYEFNPCVYAEGLNQRFMQLDDTQIESSKLAKGLSRIYSERDALLLAHILDGHLDTEAIRISASDLEKHDMQELLLLAFDERILIPIDSRGGPAWEDKVTAFNQEVRCFIPPVVKAVLHTIFETGRPCGHKAVNAAIGETSNVDNVEFTRMLRTIMEHATDHQFEVGLLRILAKPISDNLDLHDFLDLSVACGMMSPCPQKSLLTGLSWYEINPVLYWDKAFFS